MRYRLLSLILLSAVHFTSNTPDSVVVRAGDSTQVPCGVTLPVGAVVKVVMWYRTGQLYASFNPDTDQAQYMRKNTKENARIAIVSTLSLNISQSRVSDSTDYMCDVFFGSPPAPLTSRNSTTVLVVQDKPGKPAAVNVTGATSRTISASWSSAIEINNDPILRYILHVKGNTSRDWTEARNITVAANTFKYVITDLLPYREYQVMITAENSIGSSVPSDPVSYQTAQEKPSAPPIIVRTNVTASTVTLDFLPPDATKLNGVLDSYIVTYMRGSQVHSLTVADPRAKTVTVNKLIGDTEYVVKIAACTVKCGPYGEVTLRTKEGVPLPPRITHFSHLTTTSFRVHWERPSVTNGVLHNYTLLWYNSSANKTTTVQAGLSATMEHTITDLLPYTTYRIKVAASTATGQSDFSEDQPVLTDVGRPQAPKIVNVTALSSRSIFIEWTTNKNFYKPVDCFLVEYQALGDPSWWQQYVYDVKLTNQYVIKNLQDNSRYTIAVYGIRNSLFTEKFYKSRSSNLVQIDLSGGHHGRVPDGKTDGGEKAHRQRIDKKTGGESTDNATTGIIAGCAALGVIVFIVVAVFISSRSLKCRQYYRAAFQYLYIGDNSTSTPVQFAVVVMPESYENANYQDIAMEHFAAHVEAMHADSGIGFAQQFEEINQYTRCDLKSDNSSLAENRHKNRYINISAYDHSRVCLKNITGRQKHSDYINANYVDGYVHPKAYIATQGPLPQTIADFWRMVWEENSSVIVMITNLVERSRRKCDQYWPNDGAEVYGTMSVKLVNTFTRADYTVRILALRNLRIKKKVMSERVVYQYHFTEWPDHGVPDFTLPVLKFVCKSSQANLPHSGPIVIHCSAGVGRTGTYIIIDSMIRRMADTGTINVANFLLHIRQQRNYLVQTEDQYSFIHDVLLEYIQNGGCTEITHEELSKFIDDDKVSSEGDKASLVRNQYSMATSWVPKDYDYLIANKIYNIEKNRSKVLLPVNLKRVPIPTRPGVEGSDYINASYLQGYTKMDEFIVTQYPLGGDDFWRMVWDQNSCTIVLLCHDMPEEEFEEFWPRSSEDGGFSPESVNFRLAFREENHDLGAVLTDFILESTQDDYVLMTRMFATSGWPESCSPLKQVFELINVVRKWYETNDSGPVIVIDRYGGVQAGCFCALWTLYEEMLYDGCVDIYQLAKLYHLKRPGVIGSQDDYHFLYRAIESIHADLLEKSTDHVSLRHHHRRDSLVRRDGDANPSSVRLSGTPPTQNGGMMRRSRSSMAKMETKI